MGSFIRSKWAKTSVLLNHNTVAPLILETRKMTESSLYQMLEQYGMVYIKPDKGTYGRGVMRIEKRVKGGSIVYRRHAGIYVKTYAAYNTLYSYIRSAAKGRLYLVQRGIELTRYQRKRFDIRVMVQRHPATGWEVTGIIARVAQLKKVVTNYHNGGTPMSAERVLASLMQPDARRSLLERLMNISMQAARQMRKGFPNVDEVGVDIGLDQALQPWIIEINTRPDPYIFKRLKDKTVFRKVYKYHKMLTPMRRKRSRPMKKKTRSRKIHRDVRLAIVRFRDRSRAASAAAGNSRIHAQRSRLIRRLGRKG